MIHKATRGFWKLRSQLPDHIQDRATKQFVLLKADPTHPSLRFKPVGKYWSVRVNDAYRALAIRDGDTYVWFFIGNHDDADRAIGND